MWHHVRFSLRHAKTATFRYSKYIDIITCECSGMILERIMSVQNYGCGVIDTNRVTKTTVESDLLTTFYSVTKILKKFSPTISLDNLYGLSSIIF